MCNVCIDGHYILSSSSIRLYTSFTINEVQGSEALQTHTEGAKKRCPHSQLKAPQNKGLKPDVPTETKMVRDGDSRVDVLGVSVQVCFGDGGVCGWEWQD